MIDTAWMERRLCRHMPRKTFFPSDPGGVATARRICARCPVRAECLEYALRLHIADGIWGGTSERMREKLQRKRRREHGTDAAH